MEIANTPIVIQSTMKLLLIQILYNTALFSRSAKTIPNHIPRAKNPIFGIETTTYPRRTPNSTAMIKLA